MADKPLIDLSVGNPIHRFERALDYGVEQSRQRQNAYDDSGAETMAITKEFCPFFSRICGQEIMPENMCVTTGSSAGFSMILDDIKQRMDSFNRASGQHLQPVIICPVPTYGLFMRTAEVKGVTVVPVFRDPKRKWQVNPAELDKTIDHVNKSGKALVVAYFDSNPNNPCGTIRGKEETEAIAKVLDKHNAWMEQKADEYAQKGLAIPRGMFMSPQRLFPQSITIVDDMIYMGTEYPGHKEPYSFMRVPEVERTVRVLAGGSKIGNTDIRSGVIVSDIDSAERYREQLKLLQYFPSRLGTHSMVPVFSESSPHVEHRREHLAKLVADQKFSGDLMKALINGIDDVKPPAAERARMIRVVADRHQVPEAEAERQLKQGMKAQGVRVITTPESGFFHLIDFNATKDHFARDMHNQVFQIEKQEDFEMACHAQALRFCAGNYCGISEKDLTFRASFASPPEAIVDAVDRMGDVMRACCKSERDAAKLPLHPTREII